MSSSYLAATILCAAVAACALHREQDETVSEARWRPLFDGKSTDGWRGYKQESVPAGWQVVDGTLARVDAAGDLISVETFEDFELVLEWKIAPGGNSGIFFGVAETADAVYHTGPEYQILDNEAHGLTATDPTAAGANYALHAPAVDAARPAGEWNSARILVDDGRVEHWLNGRKVVEYELWSSDWEARVAASKFAAMPGYGRTARGHLALQDHGSGVWFRAIEIREL